jgi:hypothetical protein
VGQLAHAVEQNSWPMPQGMGTHWPPLTPEPSTHDAAMQAGPEHVVVATPLVGQGRQAPPHERWLGGQVAGRHVPLNSSQSAAQAVATQVSLGPHAVAATAVVGPGAQAWPQARSWLEQVKAWHVRLLGPVAGHRVPLAQAPQLATVREVPHRSVAVRLPQLVLVDAHSSASVCGVQPHRLAMPAPPQVFTPEQLPQLETLRLLPHESVPESAPHTAPIRAQN